MLGEYHMQTLEQADERTQSNSNRIEDHSRPSNVNDLLQLILFIATRSICGILDQRSQVFRNTNELALWQITGIHVIDTVVMTAYILRSHVN